uniref:Protein root UVB sensitive/RUS domain-containing protein n=1 Tax=Glossina austeni TaxID=7395 RepID=A0A1A9UNZ9_GLOAU
MPVVTPLAGLIRWSVLSPLVETRNETSQKRRGRPDVQRRSRNHRNSDADRQSKTIHIHIKVYEGESELICTLRREAHIEYKTINVKFAQLFIKYVIWILKEGSGHLGRILFSWWKGAQLDVESKKWRLRADFLNDCAMGLEISMLPKYPHLSTYVLCGTTFIE